MTPPRPAPIAVLTALLPLLAAAPAAAQDEDTAPPGFLDPLFQPEPEIQGPQWDWLRLTSGEWLKGEVKTLRKGTLEFESDELGGLELDWSDVAELRSPRHNTVLLVGRTTVEGQLHVTEDTLRVIGPDGERVLPRSELRAVVPGEPTEWNYWSGKLSLGLTLRRGNTNQSDLSILGTLRREVVWSRLRLDYNGTISSLDDVETANSHRANGKFDLYLTRRFFVTPLAVEYFRDPFQNIHIRLTPSAGFGYTVFDRDDLEWELETGAGYQYTKFSSVPQDDPFAPRETSNAALRASTYLDAELNDRVDLRFDYAAQISLAKLSDINHHAVTVLSVELTDLLDLDVSLTWDRVEAPQPDADGVVPKKDDLRLAVGIGVEF